MPKWRSTWWAGGVAGVLLTAGSAPAFYWVGWPGNPDTRVASSVLPNPTPTPNPSGGTPPGPGVTIPPGDQPPPNPNSVPEPTTAVIGLAGLAAWAAVRRRMPG